MFFLTVPDMDDFLHEIDEDVEGMQSTIYLLQQQLKEAKDEISQLQNENSRLGGHLADNMKLDGSVKGESNSRRSTPTPNAIDAHVEHDERERTRHMDEKPQLSPTNKAGYQRTSRQSSASPPGEVLVSNRKKDHQIGSKQDNLHTQTTRRTATNGGHEHTGFEAMDTSDSGFHRESCDADSTTGDHNPHRQFKGSLKTETSDGSSIAGNNIEVNNHHQGDANSDASYVITENTNAASSANWSPPSRHHEQSDDVEMEDDTKIKSEIKGRTVGGIDFGGSDDDHQTLLQNGLVDTTPQYESQNDDDVVA